MSPGAIGEPVVVGGATIRQGDVLVLDADGVAVVEAERVDEVLEASRERAEREGVKRAKLQDGALSYDLDGLREKVEAATDPEPEAATSVEPIHDLAHIAHAELLTPFPDESLRVLRRPVRDADRAPRGPVGVPARVGRVPALRPEADRVRAARPRPHRAPRLEPGGARAAGGRDRGDGARHRLERRRPRARPGVRVPRSRRPPVRDLLRAGPLRAARAPAPAAQERAPAPRRPRRRGQAHRPRQRARRRRRRQPPVRRGAARRSGPTSRSSTTTARSRARG